MEQFNKTSKDLLRRIIQGEGREWEKYLFNVLFAYREVPQESTGFCPFELTFGRDIQGPLDILKEQWCMQKLDICNQGPGKDGSS